VDFRPIPSPIRAGAMLALTAILFGFLLGGLFGLNEDAVKGRLEASGNAALATAYQGNVAAKDAVVTKSWDYLKRAHLHGGGIGAAALGAIAMIVLMTGMGRVARLSAIAFGAGAIVYSVFWLWAGFKAPGMGSTGAAKEALAFIAVPGAGLALLGVVGTIWAVTFDRREG
jgi:amino acid transporter